jgi:hypothetical protein
LKRAFEDFINVDNKVSKLLAKYANDVLKKGSKVEHRESVSSTLENIVFLYGYIQEKDVFERDYQLFLANRLLHAQCESEHAEKEMIAKLKTECMYDAPPVEAAEVCALMYRTVANIGPYRLLQLLPLLSLHCRWLSMDQQAGGHV